MNFIIVKVRNYIYTMVCEDVKQIIYSYTYTGKDPATYELYCDYYDKLYDFITKDFCIHKNYLHGSTIKIIMDLNKDKVEHIKKRRLRTQLSIEKLTASSLEFLSSLDETQYFEKRPFLSKKNDHIMLIRKFPKFSKYQKCLKSI